MEAPWLAEQSTKQDSQLGALVHGHGTFWWVLGFFVVIAAIDRTIGLLFGVAWIAYLLHTVQQRTIVVGERLYTTNQISLNILAHLEERES